MGMLARLVPALVLAAALSTCATLVPARDRDGRFAGSPLKPWFDQLKSGKGLCCSIADGTAVADPDWESAGGHYRVRLEGRWIDVPDDAVVTEPNRAGQTMVWPMYLDGQMVIRCFLPGPMA